MKRNIYRSISKPIREDLSWEDKWNEDDNGLIISWEVGRKNRVAKPDLAKAAERGELPIMGWKGGVAKKLKKNEKFGSLKYLAQWQGLRNQDLDIDPSQAVEMVCSRTKMKVIFTPDTSKLSNP